MPRPLFERRLIAESASAEFPRGGRDARQDSPRDGGATQVLQRLGEQTGELFERALGLGLVVDGAAGLVGSTPTASAPQDSTSSVNPLSLICDITSAFPQIKIPLRIAKVSTLEQSLDSLLPKLGPGGTNHVFTGRTQSASETHIR